MAMGKNAGKAALKFIQKGATPESKKKEGKGHHFLEGLKAWVTSPGGIITLVLIIGTIWYVHHNYKEKA